MARNGAGTYSLPAGNPVVNGTVISDTWANTTLSDIGTALTQSIAKDGQTVPTANLPMGGFKHTGLSAGTANGDSVRYEQLASTVAPYAPLSGATFTGYINEARGTVTMHATTMNLWAQPNTIDGTGSAVTITAIANAPQAGAKRTLYPITGTVITNGATFAVDGAANYTTAAGDALEFEAVTTSTYKVHITKKDGTAVVASSTGRVVYQIQTYATGAVATGTTAIPPDNTIPQQTEGDQYMSLAITPQNASSTLEIDVEIFLSHSASVQVIAALFQDATANAIAAGGVLQQTGTGLVNLKFKHIMTSGTTSAITFKVRGGGGAAGTTTFNGQAGAQFLGGVMGSRITVKEYLP